MNYLLFIPRVVVLTIVLVPFQFASGCVWAVLGLFFAVMMNAHLLLPNALMPEAVRLVHIAETAPSNSVLGVVIAWLFRVPVSNREK